jgi:subtilisin family serine protease
VENSIGLSYKSNVAKGIIYAVDNGCRIINISLAGADSSITEQNAIDYAYSKGALIISGTGNEGVDTVYFPAAYNHSLAVGGTDPADMRATVFIDNGVPGGGSNYGNEIDVVAPARFIFTLDYRGDSIISTWGDGTSASTAFATGLASLLLSQKPGRTPDQISELITSTADDQVGDPREDTPGWDKYYGWGRINAYKALLKGKAAIHKEPRATLNLDKNAFAVIRKRGAILVRSLRNSVFSSDFMFEAYTVDGSRAGAMKYAKENTGCAVLHLPRADALYVYRLTNNGQIITGRLP